MQEEGRRRRRSTRSFVGRYVNKGDKKVELLVTSEQQQQHQYPLEEEKEEENQW